MLRVILITLQRNGDVPECTYVTPDESVRDVPEASTDRVFSSVSVVKRLVGENTIVSPDFQPVESAVVADVAAADMSAARYVLS